MYVQEEYLQVGGLEEYSGDARTYSTVSVLLRGQGTRWSLGQDNHGVDEDDDFVKGLIRA
jgi:hypothetical protein